ncbi:TIGR02594 family protein [Ideonella sp.]|uniref:TIGR02594 family protein n=1 Tax=Ideonella sp. TaxID=1929293 RepID=UPI0035AE66C9
MTIQRVITDIPADRLPFVRAVIKADGGRIVSEQPEADGEFTIVAEFPDPVATMVAPMPAVAVAGLAAGAAVPAAVAATPPPVLAAHAPAVAVAAPPAAPAAAAPPAAHARMLEIARAELGVAEVPGAGNNPRIEAFHASTSGGKEPDSVPWCSSFVNFCVEQAGLKGTDSKAARSWMTWGRDADDFFPGCIVVLERGAAPQGHVGFFVGTENGRIRLLGGNQGDRVSIASFDPQLVLARRQAP